MFPKLCLFENFSQEVLVLNATVVQALMLNDPGSCDIYKALETNFLCAAATSKDASLPPITQTDKKEIVVVDSQRVNNNSEYIYK